MESTLPPKETVQIGKKKEELKKMKEGKMSRSQPQCILTEGLNGGVANTVHG